MGLVLGSGNIDSNVMGWGWKIGGEVVGWGFVLSFSFPFCWEVFLVR